MKILRVSASRLAQACEGNPILTTLTIIIFWLMINQMMATIELLIFGKRFEHWVDVILSCLTIAYAAYAVVMCAYYNTEKKINHNNPTGRDNP